MQTGSGVVILVLSRFKVANGLEDSVARAFMDRPRMVEHAEGFLGLEVFTDNGDASVFYLLTRWTTESAFRKWHSSPAHHASHKGIPKGLKLDSAFTQLTIMASLCH
jgi:heme-degrading monooxygenase HmoA